ncbi:hypothetical protein GCM10023334_064440 [Nonomuraea thailandensis]
MRKIRPVRPGAVPGLLKFIAASICEVREIRLGRCGASFPRPGGKAVKITHSCDVRWIVPLAWWVPIGMHAQERHRTE